jgi:hypothetical protein
MDSAIIDRLSIRDLIESWVIWRDAGEWEKLRSTFFPDGRMVATWSQASADQFIQMAKDRWAKGVRGLHFLGGQSIDLAAARAISQTKMTISQRTTVHGSAVDVVCTGRFYDFLEKRDGRWGIVLRQSIYEKSRMDLVNSSDKVELDMELLMSFPEGYRHLAYLQTQMGYAVKKDLPGLVGNAVDNLYASGQSWLRGDDSI